MAHAAEEWKPAEVHWILEHGIKMTGMPAFGPTHSEDELWAITAFVEQLPEMTEQEYATMTAEASHSHSGTEDGGDTHQHSEDAHGGAVSARSAL